MRSDAIPWKHGVVLVCNNQRPEGAPRPSCGRARGGLVKDTLKQDLRTAGGPGAECRVLNTSCLDLCPADGVAVAILPGDQLQVVDPDREGDLDALTLVVQAHMTALAQPDEGDEGSRGSRARRLLQRLTRRD